MFKLGLIINPFAGIGGRVGLKGSDGDVIRAKAFELGAQKLAATKTAITLNELLNLSENFNIYTCSGEMGQDLCQQLGINHQIVALTRQPSSEEDTQMAVKALLAEKVDLILFAGGDGTARNIYEACESVGCEETQMVLGVPAGVKIHSGVYAISPEAAGLLVKSMIQGKILSLLSANVMDIDENAFREGRVKAKQYGYLMVPAALEYVQAVKSGAQESGELVLDDIAAEVIESMLDDTYYVIGSGTTCAVIMQQLGLENTLLGSDIIHNQQLYKADATEKDLLQLLSQSVKIKFIITVIGGQGHILGRGNHQLSPQVIRLAGWQNFEIIATKSKLQQLDSRPLLTDTGDKQLDKELQGSKRVITGYHDYVIYPVGLMFKA